MRIPELARNFLKESTLDSLRRAKNKLRQSKVAGLPLLSESGFAAILIDDLHLGSGDTVYVHSSIDQLNLDFPFYRVLARIRDIIGPQGTVLFPTYPNRRLSSYEFLKQGEIFDVRKTPSYTGILSEFARRQRDAFRSLHPTKSVCAIGRYARDLTATHQLSPYPYDRCSPYYKLVEHNAKIIGLGVSTEFLSFAYCVDDALKKDFPVRVYHDEIFPARCINYGGEVEIVKTYAHNMRNVVHNIPRYMRTHVSPNACADLKLQGMKFFRADAATLFESMLRLAKQGITVYPRSAYSRE